MDSVQQSPKPILRRWTRHLGSISTEATLSRCCRWATRESISGKPNQWPPNPPVIIRLTAEPFPPPLSLATDPERFQVTTTMVSVLSASGPRSPGVWAQSNEAVCSAGWEWVRFIQAYSSSGYGSLALMCGLDSFAEQ